MNINYLIVTDVANSGLSGTMAGHPCVGDNELTIPVVLLLIDETNYVLSKYHAGLINQLTIGRTGKTVLNLTHIFFYTLIFTYSQNLI